MSIITYHLAKWGRSSDPSRHEWATTASVRSIVVVQLVEVPRNQPKAVVAGLVAAGLVDDADIVSELAASGFVAAVEKLVAEVVVAFAVVVAAAASELSSSEMCSSEMCPSEMSPSEMSPSEMCPSELSFAVPDHYLIADAVPAVAEVAAVAATVAYSTHPRRNFPDLDRMVVVTCLK
jgi:hypothetical protein